MKHRADIEGEPAAALRSDALEARKILLIEDEPDVASLLQARLESRGYQVHVEEFGRNALAHARGQRPDLVILDLMLPDMDGYAVSEGLRTLYSSWAVPILMLTAKGEARDKLRGYGVGADAYMTKPYEARELFETVAQLLDGA